MFFFCAISVNYWHHYRNQQIGKTEKAAAAAATAATTNEREQEQVVSGSSVVTRVNHSHRRVSRRPSSPAPPASLTMPETHT